MQQLALALCLVLAVMLAMQDVSTMFGLSSSLGAGVLVSANDFAPPPQQRDAVEARGRKVSVLFCTS